MTQEQNLVNPVIENSISFARSHCDKFDVKTRKNNGQFFTPKKVAIFMAKSISLNKKNISILDPGAGTGILIAALCDRIIEENKESVTISIDAYENDKNLIPYLRETLELCKQTLSSHEYYLSYKIFDSNFIIENREKICPNITDSTKKEKKYDVIISNPPYYKLKIQSPESRILKDFVFGQPNIYPLFMIMALQLLKEDGDFVFITPRSFCSGLYFKKIRNWFGKNTQIKKIHSFESRMKIFDDSITQEVILFSGIKSKRNKMESMIISISDDKTFANNRNLRVKNQDVFEEITGENFIRIPHSKKDLEIIHEIDSWENTLKSLGLEISTGKVVDFRTEENLIFNLNGRGWVPLLWMHNLTSSGIQWPSEKYSNPQGILLNEETKNELIPVNNYILLKRFTSKCQKRRLYAIPLLKQNFANYSFIGLENHLNYIYGTEKTISVEELYGLNALLNTSFFDSYYRTLSGNTQVNANEMRTIPFPNIENIRRIGMLDKSKKMQTGPELDIKIGKILGIEKSIVKN